MLLVLFFQVCILFKNDFTLIYAVLSFKKIWIADILGEVVFIKICAVAFAVNLNICLIH